MDLSTADEDGRASRYHELRAAAPHLFENPPDAPYEILFDHADVAAAEEAATERLERQGLPGAWARTGVVFEDPYAIVVRDAVRMPSGASGTYVRRIRPGHAGVAILPRYGADQVILVRHFRHSTRRWHLEIPRGFSAVGPAASVRPDHADAAGTTAPIQHDHADAAGTTAPIQHNHADTAGAAPERDARRELLEEIGATARRLHPLGLLHPDTGTTSDVVHLFLAEIDRYDARGEAEEGISGTHAAPAAELAELIRSGTITDGYTIAAWSRATLLGLLPTA